MARDFLFSCEEEEGEEGGEGGAEARLEVTPPTRAAVRTGLADRCGQYTPGCVLNVPTELKVGVTFCGHLTLVPIKTTCITSKI